MLLELGSVSGETRRKIPKQERSAGTVQAIVENTTFRTTQMIAMTQR
jgi:hypothetical protein